MEELLNKLIEKGWQPFGGPYYDKFIIESDGDMCFRWKIPGTDGTHSYDYNFDYFKIRELVSKESGLWQFCCESKLIEQGKTVHDFVMKHICYADENRCGGFSMCNAEYYIMMCSLLEESELEQFLLDNIKIN